MNNRRSTGGRRQAPSRTRQNSRSGGRPGADRRTAQGRGAGRGAGTRGTARGAGTRGTSRGAGTRGAAAQRGGVSRGRSGGDSTLNVLLIPITVIVGIVAWLIGRAMYAALINTMPRPVLIGLIFAVFFLILALVVFLISSSRGIFEENLLTGGGAGSMLLMIVVGAVVIFALGTLFQWIYGLNLKQKTVEPTSYVFLIDDSGSMESSDPTGERYTAINQVLDGMDDSFPYMVYSFSSGNEIVKDMAPISAGVTPLSGLNEGGTEIRGVLEQVISDYKNGVWDGGDSPRVILLTDGYATDIGLFRSINSVLKEYSGAHISVSTVGLGYVDESLLKKIADSTGGVYIDVSQASDLSAAMGEAATSYTDRDLLSTRYVASMNGFYAFLRILFLTILGAAIGCGIALVYGYEESLPLTMIASGVTAVLGALIMELGCNAVGASDKWMWLLLWILIALTIALKPEKQVHYQPDSGSSRVL